MVEITKIEISRGNLAQAKFSLFFYITAHFMDKVRFSVSVFYIGTMEFCFDNAEFAE